jgi:creatinine amidohydrolase
MPHTQRTIGAMDAIHLLDLPHAEARRLLATGAPVYLAVNPVEYHGPHLSLHNDRLISRGLSIDLAQRLSDHGWPCVLADDLEVGVEPCPGTGTRHTRFQTMRDLVLESCRALTELGARRVVLMTFHGAPLHSLALEAGVRWLRAHGVAALAPLHLVLRELLMLDDLSPYADALAPIEDAHERAEMAAGLRLDFHAGFFETSMSLHYAPASVGALHRELPPCAPVTPDTRFATASRVARRLGREMLARELEFAAAGLGWNALRPFPGYTGRPHLASADSGAAFARHIVDRYAEAAESVLLGGAEPPAPIMAWAARLSAGGRFGQIPRPAPEELASYDLTWSA